MKTQEQSATTSYEKEMLYNAILEIRGYVAEAFALEYIDEQFGYGPEELKDMKDTCGSAEGFIINTLYDQNDEDDGEREAIRVLSQEIHDEMELKFGSYFLEAEALEHWSTGRKPFRLGINFYAEPEEDCEE